MKWEKSLLAFEEDIKKRSLKQWLRAYTTFAKPRHKYQGILEIIDSKLTFIEKVKNNIIPFYLEIDLTMIQTFHFGFDKVFNRLKDKQIGLFGFKPLKISYINQDEKEISFYLFAHFYNAWKIVRASKNKEVFDLLQSFLFIPI